MVLRQSFKVDATAQEIINFLRQLTFAVNVEDRGEFFILRSRAGSAFKFDCAVKPGLIESNRSGDYFYFLGLFIEALTGQFGKVEIIDV
jgi:hypothetical protein